MSRRRVAQFGGSWTFILLFVFGLAGWTARNIMMFAKFRANFDTDSFVFLNLILSMVAALQGPIMLMSQNRQANRDRMAAALDYEINLKSELEIMTLRDKLDALKTDNVENALRAQQEQLHRILQVVG